jgi:hypothetical protein
MSSNPASRVSFKGVYDVQSDYSPDDIVLVSEGWYEIKDIRQLVIARAYSDGGLYVCHKAVEPVRGIGDAAINSAIPGELKREAWSGSGIKVGDRPVHDNKPFSPLSPAEFVARLGVAPEAGVIWKGLWSAQAYKTNDMVARARAIYIANQPVDATDPPPGTSSKWTALVRV